MKRRSTVGMGLMEAVFAVVILVSATIPIIQLSVASTKVTVGGVQRMVLQLRSRRYQAEIASTPYIVCRNTQGYPYPIVLAEPSDPVGYAPYVDGIQEGTMFVEVEDGLMVVMTQIDYAEKGLRSSPRVALSGQLKVDPTLSLKARFRF